MTRSRHYVLAVLFLVYVTAYLDRQLLAMLLPAIKRDLDLSDTLLGLLTGPAFAAFYIILGFPIARIADRASRRIVLAVSIGLWSVMTMATGFARDVAMLALCRVGVGIGEAGCTPPAHSIIADLFPAHERGTALAIYSLGISAGMIIAFAAGGWLGEAVGWQRAFILIGLPGLFVAGLVFFTVREPERRVGPAEGQAGIFSIWRYLFAIPSFRHLLLAGGITNLGFIGGLQWIPSFFIRTHGLSATEVGLWLAGAAGVIGGCGTLFGGWITDRLGRRDRRWYLWVPAIGMAIATPAFVLIFSLGDGRLALMLYAIPAFCVALGVAPIYAVGQSLARADMRAVAAATMLFAINLLGLGLGPQLVGVLSDLLAARYGAASLGAALKLVLAVGTAWPILHFMLAGRTLLADMEHAHGETIEHASPTDAASSLNPA